MPGNPAGELFANDYGSFNYDVPEGATSVSGAAAVQGYPSWRLELGNDSASTATTPTISIASGFDPSVFEGELPTPALPSSCSLPSLSSGEVMTVTTAPYAGGQLAARGVQDTFSLGYDSSISGPTVIPVGGGDATESFTVTLTDPRLAGGHISVGTGNGAVTVLSQSNPTNLDPGVETVGTSGFPGYAQWGLSNAQLDKPYVFTAVVHVANGDVPEGGFIGPYTFLPTGDISVDNDPGVSGSGSGSSVTIPDSSIDGAFTFSVDGTDHAWHTFRKTSYVTRYPFLAPEIEGGIDATLAASSPVAGNSVTAGTALPGTWSWDFGIGIGNQVGTTVATPSISVASGYAPAQLDPNGGPPASSLPIVFSGPTVTLTDFKQQALTGTIGSSIATTMTVGCDTSRSVSPLQVPVGGGDQTVTFTVRCTDPSVGEVDSNVRVPIPGATLVSFTGPSGISGPDVPGDANAGFGWGLGVQTGSDYTIGYVVHVPNPYGHPFLDTPAITVLEASSEPGCVICGGPLPQTSVSLQEHTLDGPTTGAGVVTFSSGNPLEWAIGVTRHDEYAYAGVQGPLSADSCKDGGWQAFGPFKNQGDCVSYVASGGRNQPAGG